MDGPVPSLGGWLIYPCVGGYKCADEIEGDCEGHIYHTIKKLRDKYYESTTYCEHHRM